MASFARPFKKLLPCVQTAFPMQDTAGWFALAAALQKEGRRPRGRPLAGEEARYKRAVPPRRLAGASRKSRGMLIGAKVFLQNGPRLFNGFMEKQGLLAPLGRAAFVGRKASGAAAAHFHRDG